MKTSLIFLVCFLGTTGQSLAAKYHDMRNISQQIKQFLYSFPELQHNDDTVIKVNAVDRRLKLATCDKLKFNLASGSRLLGKVSVRVVCSKPNNWSFYVTSHISRFEEIYIANGSLSRGHIIRASDVYKSRKDLSRLPFGYITDAKALIGKQMKRHVQAGRILTPTQIRNPIVIKRGELISLKHDSQGFSISMRGTAMSDGAIGDRIRVKNNSSKRIVEGTISQAGVVNIGN